MTEDDVRKLREIIARQQDTIIQMQRTIDDALVLLEPAMGALNKLAPLAHGMSLEEFAERGRRAQMAVDDALKRGRRKKTRGRKKR